ncbi:DUF1634 domain-containing protein [Pedobacter sp. WC2501]|uniref:DUF1634 domain-containing protein n=1 Tax=Pedobacter sp. WC2501 TaxID=3461400 RepID=UPI004045C1C6
MLLIITPIMRIIFSLTAFIFEKGKLYIVITVIVLGSIFRGLKIQPLYIYTVYMKLFTF